MGSKRLQRKIRIRPVHRGMETERRTERRASDSRPVGRLAPFLVALSPRPFQSAPPLPRFPSPNPIFPKSNNTPRHLPPRLFLPETHSIKNGQYVFNKLSLGIQCRLRFYYLIITSTLHVTLL